MASQKHSKKEGSLKDLFTKTPAKKTAQSGAPEVESGDVAWALPLKSDGAPLTRAFIGQLFRSLTDDFATLKQEIAADIKDFKRGVDRPGTTRGHDRTDTRRTRGRNGQSEERTPHPIRQEPRPAISNRRSREQITQQWRLNTQLLTYEDMLAEITDIVSHFLTMNDTPTTNIVTLWETL
ncbi:hypothetical protein NDU88_008920 [Pleurodeles waltl]|uniref:Uncharacterized protein n=1 Tax=Pleurodeles waltl TaxID=8319 RepID=A0AAV7QQ61_PLEWA|nr:hypothetical protein NDU88_008920 [Pleurodeles waltl]